MKGYFTRLIRQTGITFGTGADCLVSGQMPRTTGSKTREDPAPIHVEERRLVGPQTGQASQKLPEGTGEDSQGSIPDIREGNIEHFKGEGFESEIPKKLQRDASHRKEAGQQKPKQEKPRGIGLETARPYQQTITPLKSSLNDRDNLTSSERSRSQNKIGSKELSERHEATANQALDEDPVSKPAAKSGDAIGEKRAWSSTLKGVREWVAGMPVPGSKELVKSKEGKRENMDERAPSFLGEKQGQGPLSPFPGPRESQQRAEPEVRDYHLSIGTISLTVEGPQENTRRKKPPKIDIGGTPGREVDGSRLSRHYIRIR
jgi:hypothetical protein